MYTRARLFSSLFLMFAFGSVCPAQSFNRDVEKERPIWQELKTIAPGSVDTFKAATEALDKGDHTEAARLYELVLKKAPQFDPALRRCGFSLIELGRFDEGMAMLEKAVQIRRSPENLISLAQMLAFPGEGKEAAKAIQERAFELAKLAEQGNVEQDSSYAFLVAELSLNLNREADFRRVMKTIVNYPDLMATHYFSAVLAAMDSDWIKAEQEIGIARSLGLPPEVADAFLASGIQTRATVWRYAYYSLFLVAGWATGLALLFGLGKLLSNLTLRSLEASDPNDLSANREVTIRNVYRKLINIAGFYYYISIPVVIFLVLAVAGSVTYGFMLLGRIPVQLVAMLIIGALLTVYKMIRSLFVRVNQEDPGRALREDEAPLLWALARDVAQTITTRPVDEIRVTPGTEVAVYEKGSFTERMGDKGKRILVLGVGVLNGFKQNGFRAVLAHEYGHLSHRDTAGGDVALRVNSDMIKFAQALIMSGQAVPWNIAFQFLRAYHFIFRRISHGATRLQEVMADRLAVRNYGAPAFQEGLTHVIRRQVEFEDVAYWELTDAAKAHRAIQNIYELSPTGAQRVEEKINEEINRPTSEDATHPSPAERFRLAARIVCTPHPAPAGMVWDLFVDKPGLTSEMSLLIETQVKAARAYEEVQS